MADMVRIRAVFNEAAERSGAERAAYLDEACRGDPELRARVESLLVAAEKDDGFLASPTRPSALPASAGEPPVREPSPARESLFAPASDTTVATPPREKSGDRVGPYKLLERLGEGGFGEVWVAAQEKPVRRKVALKIVKAGMDTREVLARFEQERQALAVMDHPNVAKVFDAGETPTGRPYFVMEHVPGVPITAYCDSARLKIADRLALFVDVCNAVQHAHQKGIIHRDLKPGNILVT